MTLRVALLAGTADARAVAAGLATMPGVEAVASLAGVTRAPAPLAIPTRSGGFGSEAGFAAWLEAERIDAVIDATHPFARRMSDRAARVALAGGRAHLRLLRPGWAARPGDRWTRIAREEDAARIIAPGASVFLATGAARLGRFANLAPGRRLHLRVADKPAAPIPLPQAGVLVGPPGADAAAETALLRRIGAHWVVARDSGGAAGRAKLDAARALGLPVALIDRPPPPAAVTVVADAQAALDWLAARAGAPAA